jgi:trigger factor
MTDETRPEGQPDQAGTAVDAPPGEQPLGKKLRQEVAIKDVGPCKKHIKVSVLREDIDERMGEHFSKLMKESNVTGFRPGKAPRRLIEKRYHKEVGDQVKNEVLMASLEQLGEDHDIAPLSPPELEIDAIEIPLQGNLVYEFEVEVRPQFDLPPYRGLKLKRPVKTITDADVAEARRQLLARRGQVVPKEGGAVETGDVVVADVTFRVGGEEVGSSKESAFRVEKQLAFKDGLVRNFGEAMRGARAGETRTCALELSSSAAGGLAGQTVEATFEIKDVKTIRLPELTAEFLRENFALASVGALDEAVRVALNRDLEHQQRRSARMQVLELIASSSKWELPRDLLLRQANKAFARRVMEMRADGVSDEQITQQRRLLEQNVVASTALLLKEHFVLQKIAETEKIDIDEDDLNDEIERIAQATDESPRRVRARLEKEDTLDALAAEMIERKALDLILDSAEYEDVPMGEQEQPESLATVDAQAVPGQMHDPVREAAGAEQPAGE